MSQKNIRSLFVRPPVIEGKNLILRKIRPYDAKDMYEYSKDPEVSEYLLWRPHENLRYTSSYISYLQKQYRNAAFFDFAIELKENSKMVGTCGFTKINERDNSVEIGYVLSKKYWGRGIACEAVMLIMRYAFINLGINRVEAKYMLGNGRSRRLMERCGMSFEGVARGSVLHNGRYIDIGICSILRDEYMSNNGNECARVYTPSLFEELLS